MLHRCQSNSGLHLRTSDQKEKEELKDMYNDIQLKRDLFKTFIETEGGEERHLFYAVHFHVSIIYV